MFAKYKNAFGVPNTGAHSYRVFNMAIVDILATLLVAYLLVRFISPGAKLYIVFIWLFIIGQVFHLLFGVDTQVVKWMKLIFEN